MTWARRLAGAQRPAASTPIRSPSSRPGPPRYRSRPEPRPGRPRARLSRLLPVLALLAGALGLFAAAPAAAQTTVSLSASPNPVAEGSSVTVTVTLSAAPTSNVEIPVTLTAGTAETGDYGTLSSITVISGIAQSGAQVTTSEDADTDDETFTVSLGTLPAGYVAGSPSSVQITIGDNDLADVTNLSVTPSDRKLAVTWTNPPGTTVSWIRWKQQGTSNWLNSGGVSGLNLGSAVSSHEITGLTIGTTYEVEVRAAKASPLAFSAWASTTGTPQGAQAYTPPTGTLQTGWRVAWLRVLGERRIDPSGRHAAVLNAYWEKPAADTGGYPASYEVHYTASATVAGDAAAASADGAGLDAGWVDARQPVGRNHTSAHISGRRNGLYGLRNDRMYRVRVRPLDGDGNFGEWFHGSVSLAQMVLSAAPDPRSVPPAEGSTVTLSVALTQAAPAGGVSLAVGVTGGTAVAGEDFRLTTHPTDNARVSVDIAAGAKRGTATLTILDDAVAEGAETIVLKAWTRAAESLSLGDSNPLTLTIPANDGHADEAPPPERVVVRTEGGTAYEGEPTVDITVWLNRAAAYKVSVDYATEDVTATAGSDYTATSGTLAFEPGETRKTVSVPITDDTTEDSGETFRLALSNLRCEPEEPCLVELRASGGNPTILNEELVTIVEKEPEDVEPPRANPHAALIAKVKGWRNDPRWVAHRAHTDRWDRVLLALGERVADASLTAMTAAEAQTFADRGWARWVEVARALRAIEGGGTQQPPAPALPAVTVAAGPAVTEGASAGFTLTAAPAPAADLAVSVAVSQRGAFADAAALGARTVTIAAGETTATFAVATVGDDADEPDGAVVAAVQAGAGYTVGGAASASVAVADDDEPVPVVTVAAGAAVTEGASAGFTLTASPAPVEDLGVSVAVSQRGAFAEAAALGARTVTIAAGATTAAFAVATVGDDADEPDGAVVAAVQAGSGYTVGGAASASVAVADNDAAPPAVSTQPSIAKEGRDEAVAFTVTLSHAAGETVTVDWATADAARALHGVAPATAGADYTASSGTLAFKAGETAKTVRVPILDDAIDEGFEHFLLRFSNPQGATLATRVTEGYIRNDDHLQTMWLSRFGRTVGSQVTDAVSGRLEGDLAPGAHATVAGQSLNLSEADDGKALADVLTGLARTFGAQAPAANDDDPFARHGLSGAWNGAETSAPARSLTGRELLLGSSFHVAPPGEGAGPALAAWGRVAHGSFDGEHPHDNGRTSVDGEVVTGTLGADADFGRILAGLAVSFSDGEGTFDAPDVDRGRKGGIESTMTTVSPYLRFALTERVSAWGLAGWGSGAMTIRFDDGAMDPVKTDLSMQLGAVGARGALLTQDGGAGMDLALKADAFFVRTESEKAANSAATEADASRVRLVLEGGRRFAVSETATLRPSLELGVRHDGGDAETGAGVELGGGVAYADAASGLSLEAKARVLVAHADSDYEEWGMSATARLDPGERGRGLSLSLSPTLGATSSAAERLWGAHDARGLAPGAEFEAAQGLTAEAGYGMAFFGDRFTGTPNFGLGLADGGAREYRLGWRLTSVVRGDPGFEVSLDAIRREAANDNAPEHGVMLRSLVRF